MAKTEEKTLSREETLRIFGNTGTEHYSGYYTEELNPKWRDRERVATVDEMRKGDGAVRAILSAIKTPMLATAFKVEPASDDPRDVEIAEEADYQLKNMPGRTFESFMREALTYLDFGHSAFEICLGIRRTDGMVYLKDLAPRIQNSILKWQLTDGSPGIVQYIRNDEETEGVKYGQAEIPMSKLLVFTNEKEGDDITGQSLLRSAYIHYKMKNGTYRVQAIGIERTAIGLPVGKLPADYGAEDKTALEESLKNIRANSQQFLVLPPGFEFEFATPRGNPLGSTVKEAIDHHNRMILLSVLAEFLDLGSGATGSFALSKDQKSLMLEKAEEHLKYVCSRISEKVIKDIVDYNYKGVEAYPRLVFQPLGTIDFDEMSQVLERLANSGYIDPGEEGVQEWLRTMFKMPRQEQGETDNKDVAKKDGAKKVEKEKPDDEDEKMHEGCECGMNVLAQKKKKKYWRGLTALEEHVDFEYLNEQTDNLQLSLETQLAQLIKDDLNKGIRKAEIIAKAKNYNGLLSASFVRMSPLQSLIKGILNDAFEVGKKTASSELEVERPSKSIGENRQINYDAGAKALWIKESVDNAIKQSVKTGLDAGADVATIIANASDEAIKTATTRIMQTSTEVVGDYVGKGRQAVFERNAADISGYVRTEVLDTSTCQTCLSLDGRIIKSDDPYRKLTKVHNNCRGEWIALTTELFRKEFIDPAKGKKVTPEELLKKGVIGVPKSVDKAFAKVGGVPVMNKFKNLKTPINSSNDAVQKVWRDKQKT